MAQLIKWPTLDFDLGYDLKVLGSSPTRDSLLSSESAWRFSFLLPPTPHSQINTSLKQKRGQPGWLSGLAPPSVQGVILETQDRVLHRAPCMEPASPSACVSASLSLLSV